uniref:Uncharacterized protein n=1 Tax=Anguilla anguilla TaxID=7936 RepID=A0A0E9U1S4_ANGAN
MEIQIFSICFHGLSCYDSPCSFALKTKNIKFVATHLCLLH